MRHGVNNDPWKVKPSFSHDLCRVRQTLFCSYPVNVNFSSKTKQIDLTATKWAAMQLEYTILCHDKRRIQMLLKHHEEKRISQVSDPNAPVVYRIC